jgi:hypothetical protein
MVDISLSGAGEGPGWGTSRPTLQQPFGTATPAARPSAGRNTAQRGLDRPRWMGEGRAERGATGERLGTGGFWKTGQPDASIVPVPTDFFFICR